VISDVLPFGGLWYTKPDDAIDYAKFRSRSHNAVTRVYDEAGTVIETHEHKGDFKEPYLGHDAFTWASGLVLGEYYPVRRCHHLWRLLLVAGHEP
jgi:hypothetical protein